MEDNGMGMPEETRNRRRIKILSALLIMLGLAIEANALNKATLSEDPNRPIVPNGWAYNGVTKKIECITKELINATLVSIKDPETGKISTIYTVPAGYVYNASINKGVKLVTAVANPEYEETGILEKAYDRVVDQAVVLFKGK